MKLHVDKETDALCLRLDNSDIVESEKVSPGVVGVEMLYLSKCSSNLNLSILEFEMA